MAMSDKDRADAEAAASRMASAEDGRCNSGLPAPPTDTPKRRFWQIHLSTAVVLMLTTSVCLMLAMNELSVYPWVVDGATTDPKKFRLEQISRTNFILVIVVWTLVAVFTNSIIAYAMEFFLRRREARKP
jgi:hypothetical protein